MTSGSAWARPAATVAAGGAGVAATLAAGVVVAAVAALGLLKVLETQGEGHCLKSQTAFKKRKWSKKTSTKSWRGSLKLTFPRTSSSPQPPSWRRTAPPRFRHSTSHMPLPRPTLRQPSLRRTTTTWTAFL